MALDRKIQKIFGKNAEATDLGVVGSKNAGNPQTSTDIATLQSLSNWETGLRAQVNTSDAPYLQDQNAIFYVITSQLAYLFQAGIAEWQVDTEYISGRSVVLRSGKVYIAIANSVGVEPEVTIGWESSWKNLLDWGDVTGNITAQADLWNLILKGGVTTTCDTAKTTSTKSITISEINAPTIAYLPIGTKIKVKFTNGSNIALGTAYLSITAANGASQSFKIAINNVNQNQYARGRFYVKTGEVVEFTMAQGSNGYVLMCDNKLCETEDYMYDSGKYYRIWRDGWVEQGYSHGTSSSSSNFDMDVSFLKNMDYVYNIGYTPISESLLNNVALSVHTISNSGFKIHVNGTTSLIVKWSANGYIEIA